MTWGLLVTLNIQTKCLERKLVCVSVWFSPKQSRTDDPGCDKDIVRVRVRTQVQHLVFEVQWGGGGDSLMTHVASGVLSGPAGTRMEHKILSGAERESTVGNRRLVALPGRESRGMVEVQQGWKRARSEF